MRLTTQHMLATLMIVHLITIGCSKNDSRRSTDNDQGDQNPTISSNGDSILQPADIAGAFMTFQIDGGSYNDGDKVKVGFRVVDSRGNSVMSTLIRATTKIAWEVVADGKKLPIETNPPSASLSGIISYDVTATVGKVGAPWPKSIRPYLSATLATGRVLSIDQATGNTKARLIKSPPPPNEGSPPATDDLPAGYQYVFGTRDFYQQPGILRFRAGEHEAMRGCAAWDRVKDSLPESDIDASRVIADTVCRCEAAASTISSVKARANAFQALLYTDSSPQAFVDRMSTFHQRILIDTARTQLNDLAGDIFSYSEHVDGTPKIDVYFPTALHRDASSGSLINPTGSTSLAWTGIPGIFPLGNPATPGGYPNCGDWNRYATNAFGIAGSMGMSGPRAFSNDASTMFECESSKLRYYCMEPGK